MRASVTLRDGERSVGGRHSRWWTGAAFGGVLAIIASVLVAVSTVAVANVAAAGDAANGGTGNNNGVPGSMPSGNPPTGHAYIQINAGGDRTAAGTGIAALSGARFAARTQTNGNPTGDELAWCTTDATGRCYLDIADIPNRTNLSYVVTQTTAPDGYSVVNELRTSSGGTGATSTGRSYRFLTGSFTRGDKVLLPAADSANATATTTSGSWISRRGNPTVATNCALNVGLLLDLSYSVQLASGSQTAITNALTTFRDTLSGTAAKIALHTFGTSAPAPGSGNAGWSLTSPNLITNAQISGVSVSAANSPNAQYTNWDAGLWSFASTASTYDVVFVLTDGYPTRYGATGSASGSGTNTRFVELENAIASANYLKAQGVHVVAVGIGGGASGSPTNLQAISGDIVKSDYVQLGGGFGDLQDYLRGIANSACNGTVSVQKNIVSVDGQTTTPAGSGWQFTATAPTAIVKVDGSTGSYATSAPGTTGAGGNLTYRVDFSASGSKTITILETQQGGYALKPYPDGKFAQCGTGATPTSSPVTVTNVGSAGAAAGEQVGFSVTAQLEATIKCQVQNQAQDQSAQLRVDKHWRVYRDDGTGTPTLVSTNDGPSPEAPGLSAVLATLHLSSTDADAALPSEPSFATTYGQLQLGSTVSFGETVTGLPPLCAVTSASTPANGRIQLNVSSTAGTNTASITNTITCQTKLTLAKQVLGGDAATANWLLSAEAGGTDGGLSGGAWQWNADASALPGPSGASAAAAATAAVSPDPIVYPLAESANPAVAGSDAVAARYVQDFNPTQQDEWGPRHAGGATGSWTCVAATDVDGGMPTFGATVVDGRNGGASVPLGQWYQCTATNRPKPTISLVKQVDDGGTLTTVPFGTSAWTLTAGGWVASPTQDDPDTGTAITPAPGTQADVAAPGGFAPTAVMPGAYRLSETGGDAGHVNGTSWSCATDGGEPTVLANATISLATGQAAVCTIVNTAIQPKLTLVKVVDGGTTGATALPSAWTLTAAGPVTVTGAGNSAAVTLQTVRAGTYTLSESSGPGGYTASDWVCTGATSSTASSVTLALGQSATCTVTNTAQPSTLTLVKVVDNGATGATAVPSDWTLTAAGSSKTVSGPGNSAQVTDQTVPVGSYALSESAGPAGYVPGTWSCDSGSVAGNQVTIGVGQHVTCTITNTAQPRLSLVKVVDNGATGATAVPTDWTLNATNGQAGITGPGNSDAVTAQTVPTGTYTLSESGGPTGYSPSAWTCTGATSSTGSSVTLALGQHATCTITNTALPRLTLVKVVDNGATGGTAVPSDWDLTAVGGQTTVTGPGDSAAVTAQTVPTGTYTLSESEGPAGYSPSAWTCTGATSSTGSSVTLALGEHATCTITNTAVAPKLTLKKWAVGLDGQPGYSAEWTLTASAGATAAIDGKPAASDPGAGISGAVTAGVAYSLSESDGPAGYTADAAWVCTGGAFATPNGITLALDDDVICTVTNRQDFRPLTVTKTVAASYDRLYTWSIAKDAERTRVDVDPGEDATFHYTVAVTPEDFTDSNVRMGGTITVANPNPIDVTADVTDVTTGVGGGPACIVAGGTGATIPAGGSIDLAYSCTFTGTPNHTGGSNVATAAWTSNGGGSVDSPAVAVSFTEHATNRTITVEDDNAPAPMLGTATWNDGGEPITFEYDVTRTGGAGGECSTYDNTATIVETEQSASKTVEVCVPQITKTPVGVTIGADGHSFDVTYTISVVNPDVLGEAMTYSLSDTPSFPAEVTVTTASATLAGDPVGSFAAGTLTLATDRVLAAGATDVYTVIVNATVPPSFADDVDECSTQNPDGHGFFNRAAVTAGDAEQTATACQPIPNWTLAKTANPASGTPVDVTGSGDADTTITYTLTATNQSSQASIDGAIAVDTLPVDVSVVTAGLDSSLTVAPDGRTVTWQVPHIDPSGSASVSYTVTVGAAAGGVDGSQPLVNVVVPTTPGGSCPTADGCTTTHPVKRLFVVVRHECVADAALLGYALTTANVPDAGSQPVTATWRTQDGTVARVDTIPAGQLSGSLLWPGTTLDANGVAIAWPGWRDLQPSDFPLAAGARVYGTQIEDASVASSAYRQPMTVTFSINPSVTVDVVYPGVTPAGCAVPRDPALSIVKTASTASVAAGGSFSYSLAVSNSSTLGVAFPVTLTDPIPADLRVTGIETDATAAVRWVDCAVTGQDAGGFGGTLRCELNAALGVSSAAPPVTLTVESRATMAAGTIDNTGTACWSNPSNTGQAEQCASSSIDVAVTTTSPEDGGLPVTGAQLSALLAAAAGAVGLGWLLLIARRRRRPA